MNSQPEQIEITKTGERRTRTRRVPPRSLFVIPFLVLHGIAMALFLPAFGSSPTAGIFEIYLLFTSFPAIFVGAFLPTFVGQSEAFLVILATNSVLVVWGFACGLHFFLYK